jgi:hypothetical protein
MEGELIFLGFIMLIGQIILLQMWNANWFKKENFKMQRDTVKAENRIKLKKMEKELGLKGQSASSEIKNETNIMDLLKNLDKDKISDILEMLQGGDNETESDNITDLINKIPPEVIENFLKGINVGKKEEDFTSQV